jgi:hypothetical protein
MGRQHEAKIFLKVFLNEKWKFPVFYTPLGVSQKNNKMGEEAPQRWRTFFFALSRALLISLRLCICEQFFET